MILVANVVVNVVVIIVNDIADDIVIGGVMIIDYCFDYYCYLH